MEPITARVNLIKNPVGDSKTVALGTAILYGVFAINKIKFVNGSKGVFVSMPSIKNLKGEFEDICHPITKEFRDALNKALMDAYEAQLAK